MKIDPVDEGLHPHGPEPEWQESVFLAWRDAANGIGGNHRIGVEMNRGTANMWCGVYDDQGLRFRSNRQEVPCVPVASGVGLRCDKQVMHHDGTGLRFATESEGCKVDLVISDLYANWGHTSNSQVTVSQSRHYDVHCRVRGTVRLGKRTVTVDGEGWRDHSWGVRHWNRILTHRCVVGRYSDELAFEFFSMMDAAGVISRNGAIIRCGVRQEIRDFRLRPEIEEDGVSVRSARVHSTLEDGTAFNVRFDLADGVICQTREFCGVEAVGTASMEEGGRKGFGYFAISNNPRAGSRPPPLALQSVLVDGLTRKEG